MSRKYMEKRKVAFFYCKLAPLTRDASVQNFRDTEKI